MVSGELRQWHKVTLTFNGPQASETDSSPNPFTDYRMTVIFTHESGCAALRGPRILRRRRRCREHLGDVRQQVARACLAGQGRPLELAGVVRLRAGRGRHCRRATGQAVAPVDGATGSFDVAASNKTAPDFRAKGRLQYVGKHYLRFAGSGEYFLKAGPDSPETLLAYEDFDNTRTLKTAIHAYAPHVQDWKNGDPTWGKAKGKALIGAINYLSSKGMNAMSLMPYNAGGDGDNVWPFVDRDDKFHYDVSKLDQWQIVFDHAQAKGIYLHFKLQEQENDDGTAGGGGGGGGRGGDAAGPRERRAVGRRRPVVRRPRNRHPRQQRRRRPRRPRAPRRKAAAPADAEQGRQPHVRCPRRSTAVTPGASAGLYLRELIARFGYELALNWNMGEENTQTTAQQRAMAQYIHDVDPYDHIVVVHTFPNQQEDVYQPHLGQTLLTGPVAAECLERRAPADDPLGPRIGGGGRAVGGGERRAGIGQHRRAAGSRLPGIHRQGQSGEPGAVAPRHPEADAVGQPDGRRRRRRVLLRLRPARQRSDARELPQPRQVVGLRAHRARRSSAARRFRSGT